MFNYQCECGVGVLLREAPSRVVASPAGTDCSPVLGQVRLSFLGEQPCSHLVPDI